MLRIPVRIKAGKLEDGSLDSIACPAPWSGWLLCTSRLGNGKWSTQCKEFCSKSYIIWQFHAPHSPWQRRFPKHKVQEQLLKGRAWISYLCHLSVGGCGVFGPKKVFWMGLKWPQKISTIPPALASGSTVDNMLWSSVSHSLFTENLLADAQVLLVTEGWSWGVALWQYLQKASPFLGYLPHWKEPWATPALFRKSLSPWLIHLMQRNRKRWHFLRNMLHASHWETPFQAVSKAHSTWAASREDPECSYCFLKTHQGKNKTSGTLTCFCGFHPGQHKDSSGERLLLPFRSQRGT